MGTMTEFPIVVVQYKRADFGVGTEEELHWMLMILVTDNTTSTTTVTPPPPLHPYELNAPSTEPALQPKPPAFDPTTSTSTSTPMVMTGPSFQAIDRHYSDGRGVVWTLHYTQTDHLVNVLSRRCLGGVRIGGISFRVDDEGGEGRWKTREELECEVREVVELIRGHEPVVKRDVEGWNCRSWVLEALQLLREKQREPQGSEDKGSKGSKGSKASKASKASNGSQQQQQHESHPECSNLRDWIDDDVLFDQKWIVERMRIASRETVRRNASLDELGLEDGTMSVKLVGGKEKKQGLSEGGKRVGEGKCHVPVVVGWECCNGEGEGGEGEGEEDEEGECGVGEGEGGSVGEEGVKEQ